MVVIKENYCDVIGNKSNSWIAQVIAEDRKLVDSNFYDACPLMVGFAVNFILKKMNF